MKLTILLRICIYHLPSPETTEIARNYGMHVIGINLSSCIILAMEPPFTSHFLQVCVSDYKLIVKGWRQLRSYEGESKAT